MLTKEDEIQARTFFVGMVIGHLVGLNAFSHPSSLQIPGKSERDPEDQKLAVIMGRVFAEDGGHPLAKATRSLRSKTARPQDLPRTVRTDSRGEYTFRDLEAGQYILRANRNGYIPQNFGQKTTSSFRRERVGTSLSVGPGQIVDGVDFHLIRAGVVEGRVVDQDNKPLERVQVMLSGYRNLGANAV